MIIMPFTEASLLDSAHHESNAETVTGLAMISSANGCKDPSHMTDDLKEVAGNHELLGSCLLVNQ